MKAHNLYTLLPYHQKLIKLYKPKLAYLYFLKKRLNLLTNTWEPFDFYEWIDAQKFKMDGHLFQHRVVHLYYELGFLFEECSIAKEFDSVPLAMDLFYSQSTIVKNSHQLDNIQLSLKKKPIFKEYQKKFKRGYEELLKGNCYQFNLTEEYLYSINEVDPMNLILKMWNQKNSRGSFGSATYCEAIGEVLLSNSPECLFQFQGGKLVTRPIKGTMSFKSTDDFKSKWSELRRDKKSQAELFMITDLLRNDLCRIDRPNAIVTKLKAPLIVPGLIHQYSQIEIDLRKEVTFYDVLKNIFPGGSITGAPKKKAMELLYVLEKRHRGFYCGSTCYFTKGKIEASINIRSAIVDLKNKTLSYQAGGGITLLSSDQDEYNEITYKHDSFIGLLTL